MESIPVDLGDFQTYPLVLECEMHAHNVEVEARFDDSVLQAPQMRRILELFEHIVQQLCKTSSDTALTDVAFLTVQDQKEIFEWNDAEPKSVDECVHEAFRDQVAANPAAPAICSFDGEFTYEELENLSNQLAHRLQDHGIGAGIVVPLIFDKSAYVIVAMLAVMKVGGACVALNPNHPKQRLMHIIKVVQASVVLTS
jgi:non-ribosomal peptide synthetase component F